MLALVPLAVLAQGEAPQAPQAWSANVPLFGDLGVSVQSQPAIAVAGTQVIVSWTDERNTMPDIFTSVYSNGVVAQSNTRITGATPNNDKLDGPSDPKNDSASSAIVEGSGRAFVAYSTQDDIVLARRERSGVGAGTWVSRTEMSLGNDSWYADARSPSLVGNVGAADNLVVVWQDYRNRNWDVYSARCNGATMKCQTNVKVSNDATNEWQIRPRLAAKGNNLIAVWEDHRDGGASTPHIYASLSADGGASWGANVRVDGAATDPGTNPAVGYEPNGQPWVVWEKHSGELTAPADIYAARWSGSTWETPIRMDKAPDGKRAGKPAMAFNANGVAFFVWEDARNGVGNADIYTAYWNGTGWVESVVVNNTAMQTAPAISASGTDVRVAWQDLRNGHPDVFMARWNGSAWVDASGVNDGAFRLSNQTNAALAAASNGDLYTAWQDTRTNNLGVWLGKFDHASHAWSLVSPLPTDGNDLYDLLSDIPAIGIDASGNPNVLWSQNSVLGEQVFHSAYDAATSSWSSVVQVSDVITSAGWRPRKNPALAVNGNKIGATWVSADYTQGWPPQSTIYAASYENGAWQAQTTVASGVVGEPYPAIAIDDAGNTFVMWADSRSVLQNGDTGLRADIKVVKRAAAGGAWSAPVQVNSANLNSTMNWCYHEHPQLRIAGSVLHAVWGGCAQWQRSVYYSKSTDGGNTWLNPSLKLSDVADVNMQPVLAVNGANVMVVYGDESDANDGKNKFFAAQLTGGAWQTRTLISDGATNWLRDEDGRASVVYEPVTNCFVSVFPDHRQRNLPQLYMANQGCNWVQATPVPHPTATVTPTPGPTGTPGPTATLGPTLTPSPVPTMDPRLTKKVYLPSVLRP